MNQLLSAELKPEPTSDGFPFVDATLTGFSPIIFTWHPFLREEFPKLPSPGRKSINISLTASVLVHTSNLCPGEGTGSEHDTECMN